MKIKIKTGNLPKPRDFYTYIHIKETTGEIFYVGKGHGNRFKELRSRSKYWKWTAEKYGVIANIVAHGLSENEAFLLEKKLIKIYGRKNLGTGNLVNLTEGGDGTSGYVCTEEHKEKISKATKGRKHTEEYKRYMSEIMSGRVLSEETKNKLSIKMRSCNVNSKKVICIETGEIFNSASEAARSISGDPSCISKCCLGKINSHKGFRFKYFEENAA